MPAVNDVGEPCAGEPHARFDGRELETERGTWPRSLGWHSRPGNRRNKGPRPYRQEKPPRQLPTLHGDGDVVCSAAIGRSLWLIVPGGHDNGPGVVSGGRRFHRPGL